MVKINEQAFREISKEIDKLAINRRSKAMGISKGIFEMSPDEEVSVTVFFKDEQPKYFFKFQQLKLMTNGLKSVILIDLERKKA